MENYVITIARGFGSGGKAIASKLSERMGIPYYERQLLTIASKASGIAEEEFAKRDEIIKKYDILGFLKKEKVNLSTQASEKEFRGNRQLFDIQTEIIEHLAQKESCIIVGKCADYILKSRKNVISIYIEAPRSACVKSIMTKMNVSEKQANELIRKTDKYRAEYYRYYTNGGNWTNPINYDMTLNSDRIGREQCVDIIENYINMKFMGK